MRFPCIMIEHSDVCAVIAVTTCTLLPATAATIAAGIEIIPHPVNCLHPTTPPDLVAGHGDYRTRSRSRNRHHDNHSSRSRHHHRRSSSRRHHRRRHNRHHSPASHTTRSSRTSSTWVSTDTVFLLGVDRSHDLIRWYCVLGLKRSGREGGRVAVADRKGGRWTYQHFHKVLPECRIAMV